MSVAGNTGRLHKGDVLISTATLFVVCWIAAIVRAYIRIQIQRQISWDDIFLAIGVCCLSIGLAIFYAITIDKMYLTLAVQYGETAGITLPPDIIRIKFDYQKWIQVTIVVLWLAVMSVKFSFLALFKNLVDGIQPLRRYWWVATIVNIGILGYGSVVTHISCPYYYTLENAICLTPSGQRRISAFLFIHLALDLFGDALILYIPVRLIWTVRVRRTQKIGLTLSLCLTILMSIVTVIRGAGVYYKGLVDTNWETYWVIICAEIGVCLASATCFRSFFIARKQYKAVSASSHSRGQRERRWYPLVTGLFRQPVVADEIPKSLSREETALPQLKIETTMSQTMGITALPRLPNPYFSPFPQPMVSPQSSVFILD
ncbi:hypothetical protein MGYG_02612 [Nannizzia gypsea CBS 118893]|uniref:Rhodopsin domain-containing protein n=1 Tax=Arthroderma gypseum (strain ATCC MYA-4604 / CBS 118893) TaxID=535722 RepID=E4UNJ0_ARTGP|nr:hypothetical protein MGYG_02612 [Nannizzia gypsea CBS 118893]EFQ99598.1 hypothetical protein MGYG_02612 [Nannizzia gypsea CBS 118893]